MLAKVFVYINDVLTDPSLGTPGSEACFKFKKKSGTPMLFILTYKKKFLQNSSSGKMLEIFYTSI